MAYQSHESYMRRAYELAAEGCGKGGAPIGGVLVDNTTGEILGEGHNMLVQEGNPIVHGEMATLRNAGRMTNRHRTTMYTTLQPCFMSTGAILQFGIPRVVIGDVKNASGDETVRFLREKGIEVIVLDPSISESARDCVALASRFREEKPSIWLEDWGGGPNPAIERRGNDRSGA
jgi:cytosine/creatinine deaminase